MIRYLRNTDIDLQKWDRCIDRSFNRIIYAYSAYLNRVSEGWEALVEDDYQSVFPLTLAKKGGISYLRQPPFCQQLGIFSPELLKTSKINEFIEAIPSHFSLVEINLNKFNPVEPADSRFRKMRNYELDLIQPYSKIKAAYSSNHLRNIHKAQSSGLCIQKHSKPEIVVELFRKYKGSEKAYYNESQYKTLLRLVYELIHKGEAMVFTVQNSMNETIAGGIFLLSDNRIIFLFSGRKSPVVETGVMHLLLDYVIQYFCEKPLVFDFEGSNHPGLARFYAGFGAKENHYYHLNINKLPWHLRLGIPLLKRISQRFR